MDQNNHDFGRECRMELKKESFCKLEILNENLRTVADVKQLQTGGAKAWRASIFRRRAKMVGNSAGGGKFKPTHPPPLPMRVDITAPPMTGAVCEVGRVPKSGIFLYKGNPLTRPPPLTMVGVGC